MYFENMSIRVRALMYRPDDSALLVNQRAGAKSVWVPPGGGVEIGEGLLRALLREVKEETGINAGSLAFGFAGCRETIISGYFRSYEFYFRASVSTSHPLFPSDPRPRQLSPEILDVDWVHLGGEDGRDVRPTFLSQLIHDRTPVLVSEEMSLETYLQIYGFLPQALASTELVYVMLKPDALLHGVDGQVIAELTANGGALIADKRTILRPEDVAVIYEDFTHDPSRDRVFSCLSSLPTRHLVFVGPSGLHRRFNDAKGRTGTKQGLRGKYITWYTPLAEEDRRLWLERRHPELEKIDLEMFCYNHLHVASDQLASRKSIEAVFGNAY